MPKVRLHDGQTMGYMKSAVSVIQAIARRVHGTARLTTVLLGIVSLSIGLVLAEPVSASERWSVKANLANVRANPNTKADTLWQLERYHPLLVLEKKGAWYRFSDFEGDQGWIHSSLLDKTATVIIKVRRANIRSGPGTKHNLLFDADKGTPFKVLQKKGSWMQVQHADGDSGWIFKTLVW